MSARGLRRRHMKLLVINILDQHFNISCDAKIYVKTARLKTFSNIYIYVLNAPRINMNEHTTGGVSGVSWCSTTPKFDQGAAKI